MIKRFLRTLLLAAAIIGTSVSAAADSIFFEKAPQSYQPKNSAAAVAPGSACNQGSEPFTTFLKSWNKSAAFRAERLRLTANTPEYFGSDADRMQYLRDQVKVMTDGYVTLPLKAHRKVRRNGGVIWASYFAVGANHVGFAEYSDYGDSGGGGAILGFERIDGKWYLTCLMLAG